MRMYLTQAVYLMYFREITRWMLDGFSATVLAIGERGAWKTTTLFGRSDAKVEASPYPRGYPPCLIMRVLSSLFEAAQLEQQQQKQQGLIVGLACWALRGNEVVDLLRAEAPGSKGGYAEFTTVECSDLETAVDALLIARSRCPGCGTYEASTPLPEAARAHCFVRVVVYRPDASGGNASQVSCLHVVDCVGAASVGDTSHQRLPEEDRIARRTTAIQLTTLGKVLEEMRQMWKSTGKAEGVNDPFVSKYTSEARLTSARESKLTTLLAPLLQGNARTWFLCFFNDGEAHYQASLATLRSVDAIMELKNPCHRIRGVGFRNLGFVPPKSVFPMSSFSGRERPQGSAEGGADFDDIQTSSTSLEKQKCENKEEVKPKPSAEVPKSSFDELMNQYKQFMGSMEEMPSKPSAAQTRQTKLTESVESISPPSPPPSPPQVSRVSAPAVDMHRSIEDDEREIGELFDMARRGYDSLRFGMHNEAPATTTNPNVWVSTNLEKDVVNPWTMNLESELITDLTPAPSGTPTSMARRSVRDDNKDAKRHAIQFNSPGPLDDEIPEFPASPTQKIKLRSPLKTAASGREGAVGYSSFDTGDAAPRFVSAADARRSVDARLISEKESTAKNGDNTQENSFNSEYGADLTADSKDYVIPEVNSSKLADIDHIRNVNESLMSAINAEKKRSAKLSEELRRVSDSQEEERLQLSIELDNLRLENNNIKSQFRKLVGEQSLDDILEYFEGEMRQMANENFTLRKRNAVVEGQLILQACSAPAAPFLTSSLHLGGKSGNPTATEGESIWQSMEGAISYTGTDRTEVNNLRAFNKKLSKEIEGLHSKLEDSSQRERRGVIVERLYKEVSKKLEAATNEVDRLRKELDHEREARFAAENATAIVQSEIKTLQASERQVRAERGAILSELAELRHRVRELDIERAKYLSIKNFAERHAAPRPQDKQLAANAAPKAAPGLWGSGGTSSRPGSAPAAARPQSAPRSAKGNAGGASDIPGAAFHVPGTASRKTIELLNGKAAMNAHNDVASSGSVDTYDSLMSGADVSIRGLAGLANAQVSHIFVLCFILITVIDCASVFCNGDSTYATSRPSP